MSVVQEREGASGKRVQRDGTRIQEREHQGKGFNETG